MGFFDYTSLNDEVVHGLTLLERVIPLILLVLVVFLIFKYHNQLRDYKHEKAVRYGIFAIMLMGEFSYMLWNYIHSLDGAVRFIETLPLHLCSYSIWGMGYVILTKNKNVYGIVFPFGIIGALALFFPNLNHGVDSFRYYQLFTSHSFLYISLFYMYFVHQFVPNKKDFKSSFIILQVIIVYSLLLNVWLDTEFLFIGPGNKPIDFAWEWPYTMIEYEAFMVVAYYAMYKITNRKGRN